MTTKEYLSQAYRLDDEINTKLDDLRKLESMAEKVTSVNSGMPHSKSDPHNGEDVKNKIIDMKNDIKSDLNRLADLRREIREAIEDVENQTYRILLYKRYILRERWEQIAVDMGYDIRTVHFIHGKALRSVQSFH